MASRNIANMHLFLEMKTKFPYLPEDTLRNYVFLYSQDQDKCISILQKESENHFPHSQQFSDYRLSENKPSHKTNGNINKNTDPKIDTGNLNLPVQLNIPPDNSNKDNSVIQQNQSNPFIFNQNAKGSNAVHMQINSRNFNYSSRPEVRSAPVTPESEKPFVSAFKSIPASNYIVKQTPRNQNYENRMMFSTTKEHIIRPCETSNTSKSSQNMPTSKEAETPKRHAVKLSITPALPFHQQQMNLYNNAVCATTSHSSRPGRHTTSLNFQLQPQSSSQYPLEISTVPTGKGRSSNYQDFGSHVQISVGSQGATFTALRLQRPTNSQNQNVGCPSTHLTSKKSYCNHSQLSSHPLNSKANVFCASPQECPCSSNEGFSKRPNNQSRYQNDSEKISSVSVHKSSNDKNFLIKPSLHNKSDDSTNYSHNYQTAPDYVQAVIKHQHAQLSLVQEELNKAKSICSNLKSDVNRVELDLMKKKAKQCSSYNADVIKKLKEENKQLRLECNWLLMEYDLCSKGQIPVGVTDEDFYSNIFTGPNDCIALCSLDEKNKSKKSSLPKKHSEEEDEKNSWICKKCTFNNHPALEKCEMCEISKNSGSFFEDDDF